MEKGNNGKKGCVPVLGLACGRKPGPVTEERRKRLRKLWENELRRDAGFYITIYQSLVT